MAMAQQPCVSIKAHNTHACCAHFHETQSYMTMIIMIITTTTTIMITIIIMITTIIITTVILITIMIINRLSS